MNEKKEQINSEDWLKNLPIQSENEGFKPDEMIVCDKCARKSPPTRVKCFYCGADLKISAELSHHLKTNLRKLEDWEKGFNLIYLPNGEVSEIEKCAKVLNLEQDEAHSFFKTNKKLPLARIETQKEAEVLSNRLLELGIETKIVPDEWLKVEILPKRLRGIDFYEDKIILILFNGDEISEIALTDINLIVIGAFFERKIEAVESMKKKEEKKLLDSTEVSYDEMLIDIYNEANQIGYRIESKGFDFSCLGADKGLLAKDNMKILAEKLRKIAPNAEFDDDYLRIRSELSKVWEVSQRNDSSGLQRSRVGKLSRINTTTVSNLTQFLRYSRLVRNLL